MCNDISSHIFFWVDRNLHIFPYIAISFSDVHFFLATLHLVSFCLPNGNICGMYETVHMIGPNNVHYNDLSGVRTEFSFILLPHIHEPLLVSCPQDSELSEFIV